MTKLIAKLLVSDSLKNEKTLKVFTNQEQGTVSYTLVGVNGSTSFSISNLQCGWRGPSLPDNIYEYKNNKELFEAVIKAINGGVYKIIEQKLFIK